jgi:hypothetical protein
VVQVIQGCGGLSFEEEIAKLPILDILPILLTHLPVLILRSNKPIMSQYLYNQKNIIFEYPFEKSITFYHSIYGDTMMLMLFVIINNVFFKILKI